MDKQNVVYTYHEMLFILRKEGSPVPYYNVDKPYAQGNKPGTKRQILPDTTPTPLAESNSQRQNGEWRLPRAWRRGEWRVSV